MSSSSSSSSDDSKRGLDVQALIDDVIGECRDKPLRVPLMRILNGYPGFKVYEVLATCVLPLLKDSESRTIVYFLLLNPREHLTFESAAGLPAASSTVSPFAGKVMPSPSQTVASSMMSAQSSLVSPRTMTSPAMAPYVYSETQHYYAYVFKNLFQSIHPKNVLERNFVINMFIGSSQSQISEVIIHNSIINHIHIQIQYVFLFIFIFMFNSNSNSHSFYIHITLFHIRVQFLFNIHIQFQFHFYS